MRSDVLRLPFNSCQLLQVPHAIDMSSEHPLPFRGITITPLCSEAHASDSIADSSKTARAISGRPLSGAFTTNTLRYIRFRCPLYLCFHRRGIIPALIAPFRLRSATARRTPGLLTKIFRRGFVSSPCRIRTEIAPLKMAAIHA